MRQSIYLRLFRSNYNQFSLTDVENLQLGKFGQFERVDGFDLVSGKGEFDEFGEVALRKDVEVIYFVVAEVQDFQRADIGLFEALDTHDMIFF